MWRCVVMLALTVFIAYSIYGWIVAVWMSNLSRWNAATVAIWMIVGAIHTLLAWGGWLKVRQ